MTAADFDHKLSRIIGSGISRRVAENNWGQFTVAQQDAMLALFAEARETAATETATPAKETTMIRNTAHIRKAALRRNRVRDFVNFMLGEVANLYDVEALVSQLADDYTDLEIQDLTGREFNDLAADHEFDEYGFTAAHYDIAAERDSGWLVQVRRPGEDVQVMHLSKGVGNPTAEQVEQTLREFVQFPERTEIVVIELR